MTYDLQDDDPHTPSANGVTGQEIDEIAAVVIGPLLKAAEKAYATHGPPPVESYLLHVRNSFAIGFCMGYRHAHIAAEEGK